MILFFYFFCFFCSESSGEHHKTEDRLCPPRSRKYCLVWHIMLSSLVDGYGSDSSEDDETEKEQDDVKEAEKPHASVDPAPQPPSKDPLPGEC